MANKKFQLKGLEEVQRNIEQLEQRMVRDATRTASKRAMKHVQDDATRRSALIDDPATKTQIFAEVAMQTKFYKADGVMLTRVGIDGGANYVKGDKNEGKVTYWRFVELGTEHSAVNPFLRPALSHNTVEVLQSFITEIKKELHKKVNKK